MEFVKSKTDYVVGLIDSGPMLKNRSILTIFAQNYRQMNKIFLVAALVLTASFGFSQKKKDLINEVTQLKAKSAEMQQQLNKIQAEKVVDLENEQEKFSYAFGVGIGTNLKNIGFDSLAYHAIVVALEDVMNEQEKIQVQEAQSIVQTTIQAMQEAEAEELSAEGERFLAENGKKSNVVTTESGLQYEILTEGDGAIPKPTDKVKVHYTGTMLDGTVFDSSVERGEPITFGVTGVIKGWTEALELMPVGSKWKLFIPQDLAYGARGAGGGQIPPYATLIFEVELLDIEK